MKNYGDENFKNHFGFIFSYSKLNFSCLELKSSCPAIPTPLHGSMICFDGFKLLSVCTFACERGYVGSGNMTLNCGKKYFVITK